MELFEKTVSSEYKFKGRIINLRYDRVELPDGHVSSREVVEHGGGVGIVALTDDGEVLLVKQYRHPYAEVVTEIPAGKLEKGEDPLVCGKRELKEETGATAENWRSLGRVYPSPGYCSEIIYVYLATGLDFGEAQPDEDEFLEPLKLPLEKAVEAVLGGELPDAKTQAGIMKAKLLLDKGELK